MIPGPRAVASLVGGGLSIFCATCTHYWEARAASRPGDRCGREGCGSPLAGDEFSQYQGPITDLSRFCFACGSRATWGVRVQGKARRFGLCAEHLHLTHALEANTRATEVVLVGTGGETTPTALFTPKGLTLGKVLLELEQLELDRLERHG